MMMKNWRTSWSKNGLRMKGMISLKAWNLLCRMKDAGDFDKVTILKPYSFVLVDEEKETIAELLLVDDDTILVNDELLKGLDKELDEFLKELLEK